MNAHLSCLGENRLNKLRFAKKVSDLRLHSLIKCAFYLLLCFIQIVHNSSETLESAIETRDKKIKEAKVDAELEI